MTEVFISYSTKNKELADAVVKKLEENGIGCWYAPRNIRPGQEWVNAINNAIDVAKVFLLLYTEDSNESKQVANEIALAFNSCKDILPYRVSDVPMSNEIKYYLSRYQWMDATELTQEQGIEMLCGRVREILGESQPQTEDDKPTTTPPVMLPQPHHKRHSSVIAKIALICVAVFPILGLCFFASMFSKTYNNYGSKVQFQTGYLHWRDGEMEEASAAFEKAAAKGNTQAKLALAALKAQMLIEDEKNNPDPIEVFTRENEIKQMAEELIKDGCVQGNYLLGVCAAEGFSGNIDKEKAIGYFEKVVAGYDLEWKFRSYGYLCQLYGITQGDLTADEESVQRYAELADKLLKDKGWETYETAQSADSGFSVAYQDACERIGDAYRGIGMAKEAFHWYYRAAQAGVPAAMNHIGLAYLHGDGVDENKTLAKEWFTKAAEAGDQNAAKNLEFID